MKEKKIKSPVEKGVANVPVIMQMEFIECGAACLAMVLAYYSKWLPLAKVRSDCGVSRDGSTAKNILSAARSYGLEAEGYRLEPSELRDNGIFPCFAHWQFNHFIVVKGFKGRYVYINDPARGSVRMTFEEFDKGFTGVALVFSPSDLFLPEGSPSSIKEFAKRHLKGTGSAAALVAVTTLLAYIFGVLQPMGSQVFVDRVLSGENADWLIPLTGILLLVAVLQITVRCVTVIYSWKLSGKMAVMGYSSFIWKVLKLPAEFFSHRYAGDIIQRGDAGASSAKLLMDTVVPLALNAFMMVFYLVIMLGYSPVLTLVGILSIVLNLWVSGLIARKRVNITRVYMQNSGKLSSATLSGISMMDTMRASGSENGFFERWAGLQAAVNQGKCDLSNINTSLGLIPSLARSLANHTVLFIGIFLCLKGKFTLGMVMTFQSLLSSFSEPASSLINAGQTIQEMRADMERIEDVLEYPDDPVLYDTPADESTDYAKLSGSIEIKNVTFGYSRLSAPVIRDFSLSVKAGTSIAVVGKSGCGKSTLSKLISGLYLPWEGEILFDGKSIKEIDNSVFTGSLAVVDQDIVLFEDSISENIRMWDKSIEDFEVILAARDAQIHDDIMERPGGYRSKLIENGSDLSGGQRQRLEIARVLSQDPSMIILDEATSALDSVTESKVIRAVRDRGITCIVIAHRLSTVRDCDEIIVLDDGMIAERGTHTELMEKNGLYRELVTSE